MLQAAKTTKPFVNFKMICVKNKNQNMAFLVIDSDLLTFPFQCILKNVISSLKQQHFRPLWEEEFHSRQSVGKEHFGSQRFVGPSSGEIWI